jgi:dihydrofolate reductase
MANRAVVTEVDAVFEGDAFAPVFGPQWKEMNREPQVSSNGLGFSFVTYGRGSIDKDQTA